MRSSDIEQKAPDTAPDTGPDNCPDTPPRRLTASKAAKAVCKAGSEFNPYRSSSVAD